MEENIEGMTLVLLGKTGAGKSAAGNTILGRCAFKSEKSPRSVTQEVAFESGDVFGFPVTVYDTPGFCDNEMEENEINQKYQNIFKKCTSEMCAFFLVIKADRFTQEERETVEKIERLLGQNRLEKTWILFTRGDELEEEKKTINDFIGETKPLKNLIQKYDQRYHVLNNKKRGIRNQVKMLLTKILKAHLNKMVNGAIKLKRRVLKSQKPKHTPVSSVSSRQIVLLGKSGVGKSAAGNTILGKKVFKSLRKMCSVTSKSSVKHTTVSGRSVSVVDTPGFFDTQMSPEELMTEIARSVYLSSPGPHTFLIVFPLNIRFTEQEQKILQMIEMLFGQDVLKYSIILFTHGDDLEGESIEEIIEENNNLRNVVNQCGGRCHIFNNRDVNNRDQVNELLQKIDSMVEQNGGDHFSNEMYEDAQRLRQEEEEERQREEEERKQQVEEQRQAEIQKMKIDTEQRVRAECEAEPKKKTVESSKFMEFFFRHKKYFCLAIAAGVLIGAVTGGLVAGFALGVGAAGICGGIAVAGAGGVIGFGVSYAKKCAEESAADGADAGVDDADAGVDDADAGVDDADAGADGADAGVDDADAGVDDADAGVDDADAGADGADAGVDDADAGVDDADAGVDDADAGADGADAGADGADAGVDDADAGVDDADAGVDDADAGADGADAGVDGADAGKAGVDEAIAPSEICLSL